jgi:hypothetical protein
MDDSYLAMAREAASLCSSIQVQLAELAAMEAAGATEIEAGPSGMAPSPSAPGTSTAATITLVRARATRATKTSTPIRPSSEVEGDYEDFGTVTDDDDAMLDGTNVELMLERSVKPSTREKYSRLWDKWVAFSIFHELSTMPSEMRGLEIFLVDSAELSGSAGVANSTAAAVAHFCALEGYHSPFTSPRFAKILRAIRLSHGKVAKPRMSFNKGHIMTFMDTARAGTILDWRAALPMALCFQQLLRGAECFGLTGANVTRHLDYFMVEVAEAKNNPEGFSFKVPIDASRTHCVGTFLADYIVKMGVILGDPASFFACKVAKVRGITRSTASVKVANSTMRAGCKRLIEAVGLDSTRYASHSCKRGAALTAMDAGLSHVQIQDLGRWASSSMVLRYAGGDSSARQTAAEAVRI